MIRLGLLAVCFAGCASTSTTEAIDEAVVPERASGKAQGPPISATVMIAGVAETNVGAGAAHMIDAWACEAAERYDQRAQVRCKDDVDAILQVKAMQASFAMETGEDMDTEALVKLMKASHYMAVAVDKLEDGQLAVTVLLADEIGKPVHKVDAKVAGLEAIESVLNQAVAESFEILAKLSSDAPSLTE